MGTASSTVIQTSNRLTAILQPYEMGAAALGVTWTGGGFIETLQPGVIGAAVPSGLRPQCDGGRQGTHGLSTEKPHLKINLGWA